MELHPLCTLFPRLEGPEFEVLKADIIANGQHAPIVVHEGLVLDGGNRYRACVEAGIEPVIEPFTGANPVSFVLSANLHRRHLTPGQQAAIVASAQDWANAQSVGRPEKSGNVAGLDTVADRAAQSGASERTQRMADKVAKASPELAKQVAHGEISLPKALEQLAPKASAWPFPNAAPGSPAADYNASLEAVAGTAVRQEETDDLFDQAVAVVLKNRRASISLVQRHLRIGYNRAARLLEQMERAGIVSPMQSNGNRNILVPLAEGAAPSPHLAQSVLEQQQAPAPAEQRADEEDGFHDEPDLVSELEAAEKEIQRLSTLVATFTGQSDLAQQVAEWSLKFEQLAGRNAQLIRTANEAQAQARYQTDLLAKIRHALGVDANGDILPAIMARRAA